MYDNFDLMSTGSEDMSTRGIEKLPFLTTPLLVDAYSHENPREYPHNSYISRN